MKLTFTSLDVKYTVNELQKSIIGLRVNQIYDVDNKTYLIKLHKPDFKAVLLLESAARLHTTDYQWPKNPAPSGFSMKLRKHLKNKRLESIKQLGVDRVVQLTFGSGPAQHHLIVELYDRGNITLTDADYTILIILRPRKDGEDTRFATYETYPINTFRSAREPPSKEQLSEALLKSKPSLNLKKLLNPLLDCGAGVVVQELTLAGLTELTVKQVLDGGDEKMEALWEAAKKAQEFMVSSDFSALQTEGYIIQKEEKRVSMEGASESVLIYQEFHPMLYEQHKDLPHVKHPSFNTACDDFFQQLESQKIEQKAVQQERDALKKLDNVRRDHTNRVAALQKLQGEDAGKGQLIELNQGLVNDAINQMRTALADQLDWREIEEHLNDAKEERVPMALAIKELNFATNTITMILSDPYSRAEDDLFLDSDEEREEGNESEALRPTAIVIDLDLSAHANARKFYTNKKKAGLKAEKTLAASAAAIKSATKKTKQQLAEAQKATTINKLRKVHWFEKFRWFISSENYLVLAGNDQQQNEVIVKRHLKPTDIYIHADLHGASSVVVKNTNPGEDVPPATLHQAGIMALCYSKAWAEKVVTSAWWVWGHQVSKTAPSGEYLTTGSFMVRGKKNFLPPSHLVYGFGFLFRLEESSVERHAGERKVKGADLMDGKEDITAEEEELELEEEIEKEESPVKKEENERESDKENEDDVVDEEGDSSPTKEDPVECSFPDTVVEMTHVHGDTYAVSTSLNNEAKTNKQDGRSNKKEGKKQEKEKSKVDKNQPKGSILKHSEEPPTPESNGQAKRGQKARLKKLKTKYKDQDEEDREMMMKILKSDGAKKEPKRQKGKKTKKFPVVYPKTKENKEVHFKPEEELNVAPPSQDVKEEPKKEEQEEGKEVKKEEEAAEEDEEEEEGTQLSDDIAIINSLTGQPVTEDELLYCVPVCAPYSALANFKYKVKLTPGPGKKGKACKTAVSLFLSVKPQVVRECDLMRAIRDSDLSRNVPGKVKVSAPNISKVRPKGKK